MRWTTEGAVTFRKTGDPYGFLSNMAAGFPLVVNHVMWRTSEALYQACRFPSSPDLQEKIRTEASPMAAKMVTKPHRARDGRDDWDSVRVDVMLWVLCIKALQHPRFLADLADTGDRTIIEDSHKDRFWGAVFSEEQGVFIGENQLGRLLMTVRNEAGNLNHMGVVAPPRCGVVLLGQSVDEIHQSDARDLTADDITTREASQMLFDV